MSEEQVSQGLSFLESEIRSVLKPGYTVRSGEDSVAPYFTIDSPNRKAQLIVRMSRESVEDCHDSANPSFRMQCSSYVKQRGRQANELKDGQRLDFPPDAFQRHL